MPTALITGPTAGIGAGFADAFASRGFDLVLVARDADRLAAVAEELAVTHGVRCEVLTADLSRRDDVDRVAARAADTDRPITALVNNARFGIRSAFLDSDIDDEQRLLDVLVTSVMRVTHAAVPGMVERGRGLVLNVSSVAGWIDGGTYSAAKSWVTVFSVSLAQELAGTGVRVTAVCPGFVHTEFHQRAGIQMGGLPDFMWLDVRTVVDAAFRDMAQGRSVSVAGPQYRVGSALLRHGPRSISRLATSARRGIRRG